MPNVLQQGEAWLSGQMKTHAGTAIAYRRDGSTDASITARVGQTAFKYTDSSGATIRTITRDFIIDVDDLVLDGTRAEPRVGDEIIEDDTDGLVRRTYMVTSVNSEPAWKWSGQHRTSVRIHTLETDSENIS